MEHTYDVARRLTWINCLPNLLIPPICHIPQSLTGFSYDTDSVGLGLRQASLRFCSDVHGFSGSFLFLDRLRSKEMKQAPQEAPPLWRSQRQELSPKKCSQAESCHGRFHRASPATSYHLTYCYRVEKVRRARFGPGLRPGPRRQARWVGRGLRRSRVGPEDRFCEAVRNDLRVPLTLEGPTRTMRGVPAPWL